MSRHYLDFDMAIEKAANGYSVRVVDSPAGQASASFVLPFAATELAQFMVAVGPPRMPSRRLMPVAARVTDVREYGQKLNDALFAGPVASAFTLSLDRARSAQKSLRVRLRLAAVPELDSVPWEYLYCPSLVRFLTLSDDTPLVRYLDSASQPAAVQVEPPLRVLAMVSSPSDLPTLEVQREIDLLRATTADLVSNGLVTIDVLDRATLGGLQRALIEPYHVFHFIGHGGFENTEGEGVLVLEKEDGTGHRVSGNRLGTLLHDARDLQLVVLNACEGARTSGRDAFSGVAQAFVQQGMPAVVAMQTEISDRAALAFTHEFYYFLSRGLPIEQAMCEVRKAMATSDEASEWGTAVLLRSGADQPFEFVTTRPVSGPAKEERWQSLYEAAGTALTSGAHSTAIPMLEQLQAERPGYQDVALLLERAGSAGDNRTTRPREEHQTPTGDDLQAEPAGGGSLTRERVPDPEHPAYPPERGPGTAPDDKGGARASWWRRRSLLGIGGLALVAVIVGAVLYGSRIGTVPVSSPAATESNGGPQTSAQATAKNAGGQAGSVTPENHGGGQASPGIEVVPRSPQALDCGQVPVGSSASCLQPVTITSTGGGQLHITGVEVTGPERQEFSAGSQCVGKALDRGEACDMQVRFRPAMPGQRTAVLVIHQNLPRPDQGTEVRLAGDGTSGPDTCIQGYVWREAVPDDHVCVTPDTRAQATSDNNLALSRRSPSGGAYGPDTCTQGYVWREAVTDDHVCVTPETRDQTAQDNSLADRRRVG